MYNLIKVEFYKLKTSKTFKGILLLMVIQSMLCPILFSRSMTGKHVLIQVFGAQEFLALQMLIAVFAGFYIGDEFSLGCIKNLISYGHKRRDIVIAKSISYYAGVAAISLTSPILITIINTIMNGYGEAFTLNSFTFIIKLSLLMLLIYIGIASIGVLVCFIWKNAIITVAVFILIDPFNRVGRALTVKKHFIGEIYNKTIFGQSTFMPVVGENISFSQEIKVIGISLLTIIVSTLLSIYFFNKAEIK